MFLKQLFSNKNVLLLVIAAFAIVNILFFLFLRLHKTQDIKNSTSNDFEEVIFEQDQSGLSRGNGIDEIEQEKVEDLEYNNSSSTNGDSEGTTSPETTNEQTDPETTSEPTDEEDDEDTNTTTEPAHFVP